MTENGTTRDLHFPTSDEGAGWIDWWDATVYAPSTHVGSYDVPYAQFPVFYRAQSLIPLFVSNAAVGHGDENSADALTLLLTQPSGSAKVGLGRDRAGGRRGGVGVGHRL